MRSTRILAGGLAVLTAAGCDPGRSPVTSTLVLNEVLFMEDPSSAEPERAHEWVEIHNAGQQDQRLAGWTLANRGTALLTLPDIDLPPGGFLVVHLASGTDDTDLSDGMGEVFGGQTGSVLADDQDEVGLFSGPPAASTVVDFVNWKVEAVSFDGGQSYQHALAAGQWTADISFDATNAAPHPSDRRRPTRPGESIGRDAASTDTDSTADWDIVGGADARENTPRRQNLSTWHLATAPASAPAPLADWTFMVYADGDNSLEWWTFDDLTEMEQAPDSTRVNIVVIVDGRRYVTEVEEQAGQWVPKPNRSPGRTWRGRIRHDTDPRLVFLHLTPDDQANETYYLGEQNMGDPGTLPAFVAWAQANYPAQRYALILTDHGYGWKGVCVDDTSGRDYIRMGELHRALTGVSVDLIGFDACLMGNIEVAAQVKGSASVFVASEDVEDFTGWPYDTILSDLVARPGMDASELGKVIVRRFHQFNQQSPDGYDGHTMAAVALGAGFDGLVRQVSAFGTELRTGVEDMDTHGNPADNEQIDIRAARYQTQDYHDPNYIDLYDLAAQLEASPLKPRYRTQAPRIRQSLEKGGPVILAEEHGPKRSRSHGLSIYFPRYHKRQVHGDPFYEPGTDSGTPNSPPRIYARDFTTEWGAVPYLGDPVHPFDQAQPFSFPAATQWDEFLHRYYKPVADAGEDAAYLWGSRATLDATGSSDSDGELADYLWDLHSGRDEPPGLTQSPCGTTDEDSDCDRRDELDDDLELEGDKTWFECLEPEYAITLSVHDDHFRLPKPETHWKTDQDTVSIQCVPCTHEGVVIEGELVYTIAVANVDEQPRGIRITDELPAETRLVSVSPEGGMEYDEAAHLLTGTVPLDSNESATFTVMLAHDGEEPVTNRVVVDDGVREPFTCEATVEPALGEGR